MQPPAWSTVTPSPALPRKRASPDTDNEFKEPETDTESPAVKKHRLETVSETISDNDTTPDTSAEVQTPSPQPNAPENELPSNCTA